MLPSDRAQVALEIERRQHLAVQDDVLQVRRVLRQRVDDGVAERLALLVPRPFSERVRRVLDEARHHVLAGRRHGRIGQRSESPCPCTAAARTARTSPRRRRAPCSRRRARSRSRRADAVRRRAAHVKSGSASSARFTLPDEPRNLIALDALDELVRQLLRAHQRQERQARVDARGHDVAVDLVAVLEHDAARRRSLRTTIRATRRSVRISTPASRAARRSRSEIAPVPPRGEAPRAERAVDLAHVVVQQHVGRAGRAHAEERADDAPTPTSSPSARRSRTIDRGSRPRSSS